MHATPRLCVERESNNHTLRKEGRNNDLKKSRFLNESYSIITPSADYGILPELATCTMEKKRLRKQDQEGKNHGDNEIDHCKHTKTWKVSRNESVAERSRGPSGSPGRGQEVERVAMKDNAGSSEKTR